MKEFKFKIYGIDSLRDSISLGLEAISFHKLKHGEIDIVYLHLCSGQTVEIEADINSVSSSSWHEVGSLKFQTTKHAGPKENYISLGMNWRKVKLFEVLKLVDTSDKEEIFAESGVIITNCKNEELIFICGAYPLTIQIKAPFYNADFEPEYDLIDYKREVQ